MGNGSLRVPGPGNNQMVFCFSLCRVSLGLVTKLGLRHRDCKKSRRDVPQLSGCTSAQKCISWPLLRSPSFFENLTWWAQSYSKWIQYTYKIRGRYISNRGDHMYTSKNLFSYSFRAAFSGGIVSGTIVPSDFPSGLGSVGWEFPMTTLYCKLWEFANCNGSHGPFRSFIWMTLI